MEMMMMVVEVEVVMVVTTVTLPVLRNVWRVRIQCTAPTEAGSGRSANGATAPVLNRPLSYNPEQMTRRRLPLIHSHLP